MRNEMYCGKDRNPFIMSGATSATEAKEEKRAARNVISLSRSLLLSFLSGLLTSLSTVIVRHMKNIHPAQLLCYQFCIVTSMCLPEIVWRGENILGPPGHRILMYIRSLMGCATVLLQFIAFRHLPVGEAAVIICSYPAFVTIAAKLFLNESFGFLQLISSGLTVVGMILITGVYERFIQNSTVYTEDNIYGLTAALASILSVTVYYILTRKTKHIHSSVLVFMSGIMTLIECVAVVLVLDKFRLVYGGLQQIYIIILGISCYVAVSIIIIATQNMDAGPVTTIRAASTICFSFLWQVIFSKDIPNSIRILGALVTCLSVVLVGFNKQINAFLPKVCVKFC